MSIKYKDIENIYLSRGYTDFCKSQENCIECVLMKKGLLNSGYDQPCNQIYDLLKIISNMSKK